MDFYPPRHLCSWHDVCGRVRVRICISLLVAITACSRGPTTQAGFDGAQTTNSAEIRAHGERLTWILGCTECHTPTLTGQNYTARFHATQDGTIYASNLTQVLPHYSDAQIERILRQGVHPTRRLLWIMPSKDFRHLSGSDMKALLTYLRSIRPTGVPTPPPQLSAAAKQEVATGELKPAEELVREYDQRQPVDLGTRYGIGRYIASVTCVECHGPDLHGNAQLKTPDLIAAGAYSRAEFERLMTTATGSGNRKLRSMMSGAAKDRFAYLTSHERDELYAYLKARAEQQR